MASRSAYTKGVGTYYFKLKSSPNDILIHRKQKDAAVQAFLNYTKLGKECQWLGKWNGKDYDDVKEPS